MVENEMTIKFKAIGVNESFARVCIAAFMASLNPTIDELGDVKTAVSEAVTNCVVHAYPHKEGEIEMYAKIKDNQLYIRIKDYGVGIENIEKARQPFYTTKPSKERSGMGFTVMEGFMDSVEVLTNVGFGTTIEMTKNIGCSLSFVCGV